MSKDDSINVTGIPVNLYVDDAEVLPDIPLGSYRNTILEDCPGSGMFIEKGVVHVQFSRCPICKNSLAEDYRGPRGRRGRNVKRRSSAIYQLGCGHRFHAGCLLDYLDGYDSYENLSNQTVARVPRQVIMDNAVISGEMGIICPEPTCFKRCYTTDVHMLLEYFIGEENEILPIGDLRQYDSAEYTGSDPPPEHALCSGASCTISGGKRKTKNKVKKKKQVKKQTKKKKQKGKKTRRKNSKK